MTGPAVRAYLIARVGSRPGSIRIESRGDPKSLVPLLLAAKRHVEDELRKQGFVVGPQK